MPPLFTNVIDDNNETSFALSKLNSDQFTVFADNDAFSAFTASSLNPFILFTPLFYKKWKLITTFTWAFFYELFPHQAICNGKNKIWYCFMCEWDTPSLIFVCAHLGKKHSIKVKAREVKAKKLWQKCLMNIINKLV